MIASCVIGFILGVIAALILVGYINFRRYDE